MFVHVFGWCGAQLGYDLVLQVLQDTSGLAEVARSGFQAFGIAAVTGDCQLGVEGGEVVEDVREFEL